MIWSRNNNLNIQQSIRSAFIFRFKFLISTFFKALLWQNKTLSIKSNQIKFHLFVSLHSFSEKYEERAKEGISKF